jgi:hypothetical protein
VQPARRRAFRFVCNSFYRSSDPTAINRDVSKVTWERIEDLLNRIAHQAVAIKADDIYKQADPAQALLRVLAGEIEMEDRAAGA